MTVFDIHRFVEIGISCVTHQTKRYICSLRTKLNRYTQNRRIGGSRNEERKNILKPFLSLFSIEYMIQQTNRCRGNEIFTLATDAFRPFVACDTDTGFHLHPLQRRKKINFRMAFRSATQLEIPEPRNNKQFLPNDL